MKAMEFALTLSIALLLLAGLAPVEAAAARQAGVRQDIPYLDDGDPAHRLDVYSPAPHAAPAPVLVHIHGGGWKTGDKTQMRATGRFYAAQGIVFVTPDYRLSPEVMHPAHIQDCAAALAWVFAHLDDLGGDKKRVFLSGHSAGAHLATLLASDPAYLRQYGLAPDDLAGVIAVDSASFDLLSDDNERLVQRLAKKAFGDSKRSLYAASPYYHIKRGMSCPEFLILNTTNRAGAVREARRFNERLNQVGCKSTFETVDDHSHREMAQGMYDASDPVGAAILQFILPGYN